MPRFGEMTVSTIREFDGGWNVVTSDLNLPSKYSKIEKNMYYGLSGNKQKRYGTELFTDLKSFKDITENHVSVSVKSLIELTIPQDTIHNYSEGDIIVVESPADLAGEYTISGEYYSKFIVLCEKENLQHYYGGVTYMKKDNPLTRLTTSVEVLNNTLRFDRYKNELCKKGDEINIITPFIGTFTVKRSTDQEFVIELPTDQATTAPLTYTRGTDFVTKYAETTKKAIKTLARFDGLAHNNLLPGHTLTVNNTDIAGNYTVIERTDTDYAIDITNTGVTSNLSNVSITYNNRRLEGDRIVDFTYFVDKLICVSNIGEVIAVDAAGDAIIIFNKDIAREINAADPKGFGETNHVCFTVFNGILTIWNGLNKPLAVDLTADIPCNFLVDEATQTNSMIPIAKYAISMNHYLVAGNIFDESTGQWKHDRIMISDYDAIGTFNDGSVSTLENGGITVDIGNICSASLSQIRGLSRYRTQLIISFDEISVFGDLGQTIDVTTEDGIEYKQHNPQFSDTIADYGTISNRSFQNILGDVCCLSYNGLGLFRKASISGLTFPTTLSTIIGPELYKAFKDLSEDALFNRIWSVYNAKEQQYMLFIPNSSKIETTTETLCFVYTIPSTTGAKATGGCWSLFTGWNFQCGCTSALNEIFFANGCKIYNLGHTDNPIYRDFAGDPEYPVDETTGLDGKSIDFEWEFGWQDLNNRHAIKYLRYASISATGSAQFSFGTWYDYMQEDDCEQKIEFVGGDANGWGAGRQKYGGGRRVNTENLFAYTAKFNLIKMKIYGTSKEDLKINSISLYYLTGNLRR